MKRRTLVIPFRKKKQGRTNYKKRLALLVSGRPRLVVRRSLNTTVVQLVDYDAQGDKVRATASSKELKKFGWTANTGNIPAAYLTGLLLGKKIKEQGSVVADIGFHESVKGARIYAALKGAQEGGLNVAASPEMFPDEKRLTGEHISAYAAAGGKFTKSTGENLPALVGKVKDAITKSEKQ